MLAMITTEEYKELILIDQECEQVKLDFNRVAEELKQTQEELAGLLCCITQGIKSPKWEDSKYEGFDLADNKTIADYINKNFLKDGILTVRSNDND